MHYYLLFLVLPVLVALALSVSFCYVMGIEWRMMAASLALEEIPQVAALQRKVANLERERMVWQAAMAATQRPVLTPPARKAGRRVRRPIPVSGVPTKLELVPHHQLTAEPLSN